MKIKSISEPVTYSYETIVFEDNKNLFRRRNDGIWSCKNPSFSDTFKEMNVELAKNYEIAYQKAKDNVEYNEYDIEITVVDIEENVDYPKLDDTLVTAKVNGTEMHFFRDLDDGYEDQPIWELDYDKFRNKPITEENMCIKLVKDYKFVGQIERVYQEFKNENN